MWSLTISRSFYEITSRALAQLHDKCSRSIRIWQLMKKCKQRDYHAWKGRFPWGIDGLRTLATDAARRTLNGQAEGQTAGRAPRGQMPNSKEGHQMATRVSKSHEVTDSGQRALSGLKCALKSDKCFALDLYHSYFWPLYAILAILCQLLPPGIIFSMVSSESGSIANVSSKKSNMHYF